MARAKCLNAEEQKVYGSNPYFLLKYSKRIEIASRVDQGELSEDEGQAQFTAYVAQLQLQANAQQQTAAADFGNRLERAGAALQSINPPGVGLQPVGVPITSCSRAFSRIAQ